MNLTLITDVAPTADSKQFEIVERKGRGHPDTLADRLAERLSCAYAQHTVIHHGAVLRHQFDKLSLMGGKCDVNFGGGHFRSPIRLLINGRVTPRVGDARIDVRDLLIAAAESFLQEELRNFDFLTDCRVLWEVTSNSTRGMSSPERQGRSAIHHRFRPRSLDDLPETIHALANDTAMGCAWAPYTPLESLVLEVERLLTSDEARRVNPWLGTDCKIMALRHGEDVHLTVSIPQVSTSVASAEAYLHNMVTLRSLIESVVNSNPDLRVRLTLNPGDNAKEEMLYVRLTGSCIESGDEGQVSRGNRLGGVISATRPYSIEGLSGKNPAYHAGKVYSAAAWDIAQSISKEQGVASEVFIVSQIDRSLVDPWSVIVRTYGRADERRVGEICSHVLTSLEQVTQRLLQGHYPLV